MARYDTCSIMGILGLGISFRRAPVDLLERLAFTDDDLTKAYTYALDQPGVEEAVILSTCNRVEIYGAVASYHAGFLGLKRVLVDMRGVGAEELADPLYSHWERDAIDHLFEVAAGLDSMVLGETQIHAQVREALRRAAAEGTAGVTLTGAFHAASRAGRRVRQETSLGAAPDAFVALGAALAADTLGDLRARDVVVIGAGQMAALSVKHLHRRGVGPIRILNRSLEHARALAERTNAAHGDLDALPAALASADLVVSATGATGHVIRAEAVAEAMMRRDGRGLVLVDLAVPRDIDPDAAAIPGVTAFDIAALRERVASHSPETAADIVRARELIEEEVRRWVARRRGDELAPVIKALRRHGEIVIQAELDRARSRLADLDPAEREAVDALVRGVAAKLLHDPIVGLKERIDPSREREVALLLVELLGLPGPPS
jgi:glutamyl-tRNA reductase